MDKFFILLTLFSIPSLITVPYFEGLQSDFSNLVLEIVAGNETSYPPYQITQFEPGQWAEVNVSLPEENYTISFLASFQGTAPAQQNPEEPALPENLPQDSFNISEENGSIVTFYFNLTEGNISEQLNGTENLSVLYTFDFNITQNETGQPETNITQNETPEPEFMPLPENLTNPNITQLNVSYFYPLSPDFSNLVVQIVVGAVRADLPHTLLAFLPSEWALVQFEVPTDEPHTFEFYADVQNETNQTNVSQPQQQKANLSNYTLNVTWFPSLAPDFSNMRMEFVYANNSTANVSHGILEMSLSEWALVLLEQLLPPGAQVNALALDLNATNETTDMGMQKEKEKEEKEKKEKKKAKRGSVQNTLPEIFPDGGASDNPSWTGERSFSFDTGGTATTDASQYFTGADPLDYDFSTGDFSLSAWFRTTSENGGTLIYRGSSESTKFYELSVQRGGAVAFSTGSEEAISRIESPAPYNDGNWHLAAAVRQGSIGRIYIDGVLLAEAELAPLDLSDEEAVLSIGANMGDYEFTQQPKSIFDGEISDPLIWGYALTDRDAAGLLHAGR